MTAAAREWHTVEEHVADALRTQPSHSSRPSQQEEPVSSPVTAALSVVWQQAAALEADTSANPLAVIISARHVGKTFTPAECVAVADFLAALENERRDQHQALALHHDEARASSTGPQRILQ